MFIHVKVNVSLNCSMEYLKYPSVAHVKWDARNGADKSAVLIKRKYVCSLAKW